MVYFQSSLLKYAIVSDSVHIVGDQGYCWVTGVVDSETRLVDGLHCLMVRAVVSPQASYLISLLIFCPRSFGLIRWKKL